MERVMVGSGEPRVVVDEEPGIGAGVSVDHLVVVTHPEHFVGGGGEEAHEEQVGRRQILELVDEKMAGAGLEAPPDLRVTQHHLEGDGDLLVEVEEVAVGENRPVAGEGVGEAVEIPVGLFDIDRVEQAEAGATQRVEIRSQGIGVGGVALGREKGLEEAPNFPFVDGSALRRRRLTDRQGAPVQGHDAGRDVQRPRDQFILGLHVVGEREHGLALVAAVGQQVAQPLGKHPRLSRPGRCDDARRSAGVGDGGELVGGKVGPGRSIPSGIRPPALIGIAVEDPYPVGLIACERLPGAAVDPGRLSRREAHVGRTRDLDPRDRSGGGDRVGPHEASVTELPAVVGVRPDEEMQALPGEFGTGPDLPQRAFVDLGLLQSREGNAEADHDRAASEPPCMQRVRSRPWIRQLSRTDLDLDGGGPMWRNLGVRREDQATP